MFYEKRCKLFTYSLKLIELVIVHRDPVELRYISDVKFTLLNTLSEKIECDLIFKFHLFYIYLRYPYRFK